MNTGPIEVVARAAREEIDLSEVEAELVREFDGPSEGLLQVAEQHLKR